MAVGASRHSAMITWAHDEVVACFAWSFHSASELTFSPWRCDGV